MVLAEDSDNEQLRERWCDVRSVTHATETGTRKLAPVSGTCVNGLTPVGLSLGQVMCGGGDTWPVLSPSLFTRYNNQTLGYRMVKTASLCVPSF